MNEEGLSLIVLASASVVFIVVLLSLAVFWRRVRGIGGEVTLATRRALGLYAIAGFALACTPFVGVVMHLLALIPIIGGLFLVCLVAAEMWILFSEGTARLGTILLLMLVGFLIIQASLILIGVPLGFTLFVIAGLTVLSLVMALAIVRDSPSAFSFSLLGVLLSFLVSMALGISGLSENPEFFILQDMPVLLVASVFVSFRRPRRTMLTVFLYGLLIATIVPVILVALLFGDTAIWTVVFMEAFACFALITSLGYFAKQASDSGSRTPAYLGAASAIIALMIAVHVVMWTVYVSSRPATSDSLPYLGWFVVTAGAAAVGCFLLAYVTTGLPEWMYPASRETVVGFVVAIGIVASPMVQLGLVEGESKMAAIRLAVNGADLFVTLLLLLVAYRFHRKGATKAAQRLALFQISALLIVTTSVLTGPSIPDAAMVIVFFICSLFALAGSPWFTVWVSKTVRKLDELSELGVAEDGAIRW